eukprot:2537982-Rhodomonas_salina.1
MTASETSTTSGVFNRVREGDDGFGNIDDIRGVEHDDDHKPYIDQLGAIRAIRDVSTAYSTSVPHSAHHHTRCQYHARRCQYRTWHRARVGG